jgi:hypothetical protein
LQQPPEWPKLKSSLEAKGAMDYRTFEQKLLDTIFTTDVPLNPATIAFLYKLTVQQASDLLQQAAVNGLLNIESDEEGNLLYTYPNRVRLPRDGKIDPRREAAAKAASTALVPTGPASVVKATSTEPAPLPDSIDLLEASAPRDDAKAAASAPPPLTSVSGTAPRESPGGMTRCRFCNEVILIGAKKCKHCHEYLDDALREIQNLKQPGGMHHPPPQTALAPQPTPQPVQIQQWTNTNATQAALLSFFVPGLGQMCSGRVPAGLLWMMFTCLGYVCFIVPGIVLHILCVINAARPQQPATQ